MTHYQRFDKYINFKNISAASIATALGYSASIIVGIVEEEPRTQILTFFYVLEIILV